MLTGATGFLGAFLLRELLEKTSARIHCLIRAETGAGAQDRLCRQLERYELRQLLHHPRIVPLCGDLAQARLGLSARAFDDLAAGIDCIYHNGASVSLMQPYQALQPANVLGTQEVLRLACARRVKPVHYVSTLSVFGQAWSDDPAGFAERDVPEAHAALTDGYAQSKWVAEKLVRTAGSRGVPVSIYRLSTLAADSRSGVANTDDYLCRLIKGCIQLGAAPEETTAFHVIPVDFVAQALVHFSLQNAPPGRTFHLTGPGAWSSRQLIEQVERYGYRVQRLPFVQWRQRVRTAAPQMADFALLPLLSVFDGEPDDLAADVAADRQRYACSETLSLLAADGIALPAAWEKSVINALLRHWVSVGELPAPPHRAAIA